MECVVFFCCCFCCWRKVFAWPSVLAPMIWRWSPGHYIVQICMLFWLCWIKRYFIIFGSAGVYLPKLTKNILNVINCGCEENTLKSLMLKESVTRNDFHFTLHLKQCWTWHGTMNAQGCWTVINLKFTRKGHDCFWVQANHARVNNVCGNKIAQHWMHNPITLQLQKYL